METQYQPKRSSLRPDREYGAAESAVARAPFLKILGYIGLAHLFGLLCCIAVHQQYADIEGLQEVMLTSGMVFGLGLVPTVISFLIFKTAIAMSRRAALVTPDQGEAKVAEAEDLNAEAMKRAKNGFKLLSFSGVCFVASVLIGISGLYSL